MEINKIKEWLEIEFNKGNKFIYKEIRSFCNKLYRNDNRDKVKKWNKNYYKKIKKS